ncbi:hypothetical protein AOH271_02740 [Helicobacter pylori]
MKIKHKGTRMFKQIRRVMSFAMLMPSFLWRRQITNKNSLKYWIS